MFTQSTRIILGLLAATLSSGASLPSQPQQPMAPIPPLPPLSFDSHVHCFNPSRHPFKPSRSYTPEAAPLSALVATSLADRIMIVQASIEDGPANLIDNLHDARAQHPEKLFRGTVFADPEPGRGLEGLSAEEFATLHDLGVRSIRIHGSYGGNGNNASWVQDQFRRAAALNGVRTHGWSLSAQLPLAMWAAIGDFLERDENLAGVAVVADHNGSATPEDVGSAEFDRFLKLLEAQKVHVKVGALHRRSPDDITRMRAVVEGFAASGPGMMVWGSDWPHVDTTKGPEVVSPPLKVDTPAELRAIRSWVSDEQWRRMLVENPAKLFDV
ncbi:hypothetical protein PspLS_09278 [Pyricularia sp. CBS 133598]|nr:hypothetical protein PspLS_09278 [Pyricularia sp. CBS 133598]